MSSESPLSFVITTGLGKGDFSEPEPSQRVFATADYLFFEGESVLGGKVCHLSDLRRMKHYHYVEREEKRQVVDLQPRYPGVQRGWSSEGTKLLSRTVVREITFLGYEGVHIREIEQRPHPFGSYRPPVASPMEACACKIPELDALPLQTRLHLSFYKEWKNQDYPYILKEWRNWEEEGQTITIFQVFAIERAPFPYERIKELFGVTLTEG